MSISTSHLVTLACKIDSLRELGEEYRSLLAEELSTEVMIFFHMKEGTLVSCEQEGCRYIDGHYDVPEGLTLVQTEEKEQYKATLYCDTVVTPELKDQAMVLLQLLLKQAAADDARLEAVAKAVISVIGIAYHDMRNILGSISGIVQLMELDMGEDDDLLASVREIATVVDRFEVSSRNTMKLYRGETIHYNTGSVKLTDLYTTLLEKRRRVFSLSGITLEASVAEGIYVSADESYIALFLNELLSNAFDSLDEESEDGVISVDVSTEDGYCILRVIDNGEGIPYDLQRHVCKLFVTTKNKRRGTGLAIIARCMKDWGGQINFCSEPSKGSEFELRFPIGQ